MERIQLSRPSLTAEELSAVERVLRSGWLANGPEARAFEEELAERLGKCHAVVLSSGTAALHLALWALRGAGPAPREVLSPAFTFVATANVAHFAGVPVCLADVAEDTFCLPQHTLARWLAAERGPAMVVHQFGYPAPPVDHRQDLVIADAACAIGAAGALWGRCACLSFHPRKILTTGEGGAILCDDQGLADELRALRAHGLVAVPGQEVMELPGPGLNYRLPEVAAAIGRVQLRRLPQLIAAHRERAQAYRARLLQRLPMQADHPGRVWQTVAVVLPAGVRRAALRAALLQAGIETQIASYGLHRLAAFRSAPAFLPDGGGTAASADSLPVAEMLAERALALPLHAELTFAQVDHVCDKLLQFLDHDFRAS